MRIVRNWLQYKRVCIAHVKISFVVYPKNIQQRLTFQGSFDSDFQTVWIPDITWRFQVQPEESGFRVFDFGN